MFAYEVKHRSGKENVAADALSQVCSVAGRPSSRKGLHESLGHPGITRLRHFVRALEVRQTAIRALCLSLVFIVPRKNTWSRRRVRGNA